MEKRMPTECHDSLTTEVLIHTFFDIGHQALCKRTIAERQQLRPSASKFLVVKENEECIEQHHRERKDTRDDAQALRDDCPYPWYCLLHGVDEAVLCHQFLHMFDVDVVMDILLQQPRNVAHGLVRLHIVDDETGHAPTLFYHRRNHQPKDTCQHSSSHQEGTEDGKYAVFHAAAILEEPDQRKQQVGNQPRQEKRHKHTAQPVEQHDNTYNNSCCQNTANKGVECNLFAFHNGCKNTIFPQKTLLL